MSAPVSALSHLSPLSENESDEFDAIRRRAQDSEGVRIRRVQERELLPVLPSRSESPRPLPSEAIPEAKVHDFVVAWTRRELGQGRFHGRFRRKAPRVAQTILEESRRYGIDPIFLMAVIEHESRFHPGALGQDGEIGLMQLMPETGEWMARRLQIPWKGLATLRDPVLNIRLGSALLSDLRKHFRRNSPLYIAAYNMGAGNVRELQSQRIRPQEYSSKVMREYLRLHQELRKTLLPATRLAAAQSSRSPSAAPR